MQFPNGLTQAGRGGLFQGPDKVQFRFVGDQGKQRSAHPSGGSGHDQIQGIITHETSTPRSSRTDLSRPRCSSASRDSGERMSG